MKGRGRLVPDLLPADFVGTGRPHPGPHELDMRRAEMCGCGGNSDCRIVSKSCSMAARQLQSRAFFFVEPLDFLLEQESHEEQS